MDPAPPSRNPVPLLVAMTAAALAIRLPNFGQSVWFDEACMSTQRIGTWAELLATVHVDVHPPLYLGFMFVWSALFGDSEVAMRLPPLVCGLASIPLTYLVGQRFFGRGAGLCAAALLTVSPVHIWYSIEARLYAPMLCLVLISVELFHHLFEGARRGTWLAYGAALGCLISVHYYAAAFVLLFTVLAPFAARRSGAPGVGRRVLLWNLVALGLLAAWVGFKLSFAQFETSQHYLRPFTIVEMYRLLFEWFWTGDCIPAGLSGPTWQPRWVLWVAFQALGVALFAVAVSAVFRARRERPDALIPVAYVLVLPVLLLVFCWVGFPNTYIERSAIAALPFSIMIAAHGLVSIRPRGLRTAAGVVLAGMCAANLAAYYAYGDELTVYKPHPDWRGLSRYLGEELAAGAAGRPVFTPMPNPRSLSYYDARIQHEQNLAPTPAKLEHATRALEDKLGAALGGALADLARSTVRAVERRHAELRAATELMVYPTGDGSLAGLELEHRRSDGIAYLIHNHRHPPGDRTVAQLLTDARLQVLETRCFRSLTVHKVREAR